MHAAHSTVTLAIRPFHKNKVLKEEIETLQKEIQPVVVQKQNFYKINFTTLDLIFRHFDPSEIQWKEKNDKNTTAKKIHKKRLFD